MELTIRAALTKKKMLDKQIDSMTVEKYFATTTPNNTYVEGMPLEKWEKHARSRFQSFNDKVKLRDKLNVAVIQANATNFVEVPIFVGLNSKPTTETEKISFAAAISRKNFYSQLLKSVRHLIRKRDEQNETYAFKVTEAENIVRERMSREYGNTTVAVSSSERNKREEEMLKQYLPTFSDPNNLSDKLRDLNEYLEEYISEIDSILGHATEVTMITVEEN